MTGHHGPGMGYRGLGCRAGCREGKGVIYPPQECRKEARQLGPTSGCAHPVSVSYPRHTGIYSSLPQFVPPPLGEAAAEDALGALAGNIRHQNSPVPVETSGHDVLAEVQDAQDRREHCSHPFSAANSLISGSPCLLHSTRPMPLL